MQLIPSIAPRRDSRRKPHRAGLLLVLLLASALGAPAADPPAPNVTAILEPEKQGAELAARLRNATPAEPAQFAGKLFITTRDDKTTAIPIASVVHPATARWILQYTASSTDPKLYEQFVIDHTSGLTNSYQLYHQTNTILLVSNKPPSAGPVMQQVTFLAPSELVRPFVGSDFWLCDLALDFLHWPQQRVLKHEMRRSRSCWVLESVTPSPIPGGYARVVSWVDVEHDGILRAEAYDKAGKAMKEFTLGSLRKVDGRYQLESMKMRNVRTGSETELKFDLQTKP